MRIVLALVVWFVVAVVLELAGKALTGGDGSSVGAFLADNNVLLGFLCGLIYYFFGERFLR